MLGYGAVGAVCRSGRGSTLSCVTASRVQAVMVRNGLSLRGALWSRRSSRGVVSYVMLR